MLAPTITPMATMIATEVLTPILGEPPDGNGPGCDRGCLTLARPSCLAALRQQITGGASLGVRFLAAPPALGSTRRNFRVSVTQGGALKPRLGAYSSFVEQQVADYDEVRNDGDVHHGTVDAEGVNYEELDEHQVRDYHQTEEPPNEYGADGALEHPVAAEGDEVHQAKVDDEIGSSKELQGYPEDLTVTAPQYPAAVQESLRLASGEALAEQVVAEEHFKGRAKAE